MWGSRNSIPISFLGADSFDVLQLDVGESINSRIVQGTWKVLRETLAVSVILRSGWQLDMVSHQNMHGKRRQ